MCGIVGAVAQRDIAEILLEGLRRLEYRGYDSAGLAVVDSEGHMTRVRRLGKVQMLAQAVEEQPLHGGTGIAHTRWATHGEPSESNAHPHVSEHIVVVHNGIIENHEPLRALLQSRGYVFVTETDTEVIAHLVHWELEQGGTLREAVLRAIPQLRGAYGTVIMDTRDPGTLLAARSGSPLVIGLGMGENFIASDQLALLPVTRRFIFLEEGDIAEVTRRSVVIFDKSAAQVKRQEIESNLQYDAGDKGIYRHYMQKEIFEQPNAIKNTLTGRISHGEVDLSELGPNANEMLAQVEHIQIVACGTSYNSGMVSRYWFEALAGVPCDVEIASEFRYRKSAVRRNSLMITLSQSGETADTLAALRLSKELGYLGSLAICNVPGSSLVRESDLALMTKAGTEIGVASTKAFTTQLTVLLMLVAKLARLKGQDASIEHDIVHGLQALPNRIEQMLSQDKRIEQLAERFSDKHHALFLGRGDQCTLTDKDTRFFRAGDHIGGLAVPPDGGQPQRTPQMARRQQPVEHGGLARVLAHTHDGHGLCFIEPAYQLVVHGVHALSLVFSQFLSITYPFEKRKGGKCFPPLSLPFVRMSGASCATPHRRG